MAIDAESFQDTARPAEVVQESAQLAPPQVVEASLPYGMLPAVRKPHPSKPIDLGKYYKPEEGEGNPYEGWCVVFDRTFDMSMAKKMRQMQETADSMEKLDALLEQIERLLIAWNFADFDGNPVPQPRQGGAMFCPQELLKPLFDAFSELVNPPKAGASQ